jgi:hypothetical protein
LRRNFNPHFVETAQNSIRISDFEFLSDFGVFGLRISNQIKVNQACSRPIKVKKWAPPPPLIKTVSHQALVAPTCANLSRRLVTSKPADEVGSGGNRAVLSYQIRPNPTKKTQKDLEYQN